MKNIQRHRKPFLVAAMLIALACGPQVVFRTGDVIINNDEPVLETSANSLEYGYKGSRYIKKIWPKKEPAVLTAVGDVALNFATMKEILDYKAKKTGRENAMSYPFARVRKEFTGIAFCNLEAPVTDYPLKAFNDKDEIFYFQSPGGSEEILQYAGIDVASLANNHIKDCGVEGMFDTQERLVKLGIAPAGTGRNINESLRPVFVWHRGTRVAIFAFNAVIPKSVWADINTPGTAGGSDELLCAAVKKVRPEVDAVVVSIHWGQEVTSDYPVEQPEKEQVVLAHRLINAGASCIIGHQSHGLGPVERYGSGIIFYSLGDFVFAGRHSDAHRTSMMVRVSLSEKGLESYTLIPVNINPLEVSYSPVILENKKGDAVINRVLSVRDDRYSDYYTSLVAGTKKQNKKETID
ncbi:MAG TPA: CapA family protein [Spirochaetota bacterium]|nr:CapA family protein [Spirochaetota bacterium]